MLPLEEAEVVEEKNIEVEKELSGGEEKFQVENQPEVIFD